MKFLWFVIGSLFGGIVTGAVIVALVGLELFAPGKKNLEQTDAGGFESIPPVKPVNCPQLSPATAPWHAADDTSAAKRIARLEVPRSLERRVGFWKQIWGQHPDHVYFFIDRRRPWVIHRKIDCRDLLVAEVMSGEAEIRCDQRLIDAKKKLKRTLRRQRRRPRRALLGSFDNNRRFASNAYRNLMVIEGRKGSFDRAHQRIERYLADVEHIFLSQGLLPSLARVAIIESLANPLAASPQGAVGAYQFVAGTARQYLTVNDDVDERLDPLREGWAAASYLKELYTDFRSWPLALTAYNTGPARLKRVIRHRRTRDIGKLADRGGSGNFGFDGQNYYAQLAAIIELIGAPLAGKSDGEWSVYRVEKPLPLSEASRCLAVAKERIARENPALLDSVIQDQKDIPIGYLIVLRKQDEAGAQALPQSGSRHP
ncbi:MAG TPA: lytic transglycosylase domain-containing protein [Myxococcota bacterium]|nr:lytic transglycosylase domain-containing protein [Myxococcota bacterium]